ncbi:MAG TPA: UDP-3-O-(3-hydroxymyristoyl)glucosamine N-acyltransferase [Alphaproteobacteria bacterium]|nr:UDP-3-O-(3-hydroxymyristoyl)glucosamine N-acyltransferase [Alphaproteobacteria bacterium]
MKLSEIATALNARLLGDGTIEIDRPVHPADAEGPRDLALAMDPALVALLDGSPVRAAVVRDQQKVPAGRLDGCIVVGRSRYAMSRLLDIFNRPPHFARGVDKMAVVAAGATLGEDVSIGPFCYVGANAKIGDRTILMANVTVGAEAIIGHSCLFHAGVRIGERVAVGNRVIIHHNASIGADGFSFVTPEPGSVESAKATGNVEGTNREIVRVNSIGTVMLGDDVEVGACSAIDRGTVSATRVGRNTKIDDLVLVGHNCVIGENCMLCGQVGIAGSSVIEDRVVLGGQAGVADHVVIGSDSVIAGGTLIGHNVPPKSILMGYPPLPKKETFEMLYNVRRLGRLVHDVDKLKEQLNHLKKGG